MSSSWCAAALGFIALVFAPAAHAVSVVITADHAVYLPGDTITLTVRVTTSDSPATLDNAILGRILHNSPYVTPLYNPVQTNLPGGFSGPVLANTPGGPCTATECRVFDQIAFPSPINPGVTNFPIATVQYTVIAVGGTYSFTWKTVNPGKFDFFGLTNAPGVTITLVPEPTSAALLGLGLLGLAVAGRRES